MNNINLIVLINLYTKPNVQVLHLRATALTLIPCVVSVVGCCFVTYYTRKSALEAQNALHNMKILPGVSAVYIEFIIYLFIFSLIFFVFIFVQSTKANLEARFFFCLFVFLLYFFCPSRYFSISAFLDTDAPEHKCYVIR